MSSAPLYRLSSLPTVTSPSPSPAARGCFTAQLRWLLRQEAFPDSLSPRPQSGPPAPCLVPDLRMPPPMTEGHFQGRGHLPLDQEPPRAGSGPDPASNHGRCPRNTDKQFHVGASALGCAATSVTGVPWGVCLSGSVSGCVCACPSVCVSPCPCLSVCFYVCVRVHCDLSWHSGLGSKLKPLAWKATGRTGIFPKPLNPRLLSTTPQRPSSSTCVDIPAG